MSKLGGIMSPPMMPAEPKSAGGVEVMHRLPEGSLNIGNTPPPGAERHSVNVPNHHVWRVEELLTPDECKRIINQTEEYLQPVTNLFPTSHRNSKRALIMSSELATNLFNRILPFFRIEDIRRKIPLCYNNDGVWFPHSCNECIKVSKYENGGHFADHRDGPWIPCENRASIYSFIVHLNDGWMDGLFGGGETTFLEEEQVEVRKQEPRLAKQNYVLVKPKVGQALLFDHDTIHGGNPVKGFPKYILRTEVIFVRTHSVLGYDYDFVTSEEYQIMRRLYDKSREHAERGNAAEAVQVYQEVIALQIKARENGGVNQQRQTRLSDDVMSNVLNPAYYGVTNRDLISLMLGSKKLYYDVTTCRVWEDKVQADFPHAFEVVKSQRRLVDWFCVYVEQSRLKKYMDHAIIIMPGIMHRWLVPPELAQVKPSYRMTQPQVLPNYSGRKEYSSRGYHCSLPEYERFMVRFSTTDLREQSPLFQNIFSMNKIPGNIDWHAMCHGILSRLARHAYRRLYCFISHPEWDDDALQKGTLVVNEILFPLGVAMIPPAICAMFDTPCLNSEITIERVYIVDGCGKLWRCIVNESKTAVTHQMVVDSVEPPSSPTTTIAVDCTYEGTIPTVHPPVILCDVLNGASNVLRDKRMWTTFVVSPSFIHATFHKLNDDDCDTYSYVPAEIVDPSISKSEIDKAIVFAEK